MRIAGGEYKGRVLKVPKSSKIRPSTEKTREAIFSVLGGDILDAKVADLFCGSGALGLGSPIPRRGKRTFRGFAAIIDIHC